MIIGARRDPEWGTILIVGLGGVWTEALGDVRLLSPDLDQDAIIAALERLSGAALLAGMRGAPAIDKQAVAKVAIMLADMMHADPALLDIEINPLMAYPAGVVALDALMITAEGDAKLG